METIKALSRAISIVGGEKALTIMASAKAELPASAIKDGADMSASQFVAFRNALGTLVYRRNEGFALIAQVKKIFALAKSCDEGAATETPSLVLRKGKTVVSVEKPLTEGVAIEGLVEPSGHKFTCIPVKDRSGAWESWASFLIVRDKDGNIVAKQDPEKHSGWASRPRTPADHRAIQFIKLFTSTIEFL